MESTLMETERPIKVHHLQSLMIQFANLAVQANQLPVIFSPMGAGASTVGKFLAVNWTRFIQGKYARFVSYYETISKGTLVNYLNEKVPCSFRKVLDFKDDDEEVVTIFDDCFVYENTQINGERGLEVANAILNWKVSRYSVVFAKTFGLNSPANLLINNKRVATLAVGVNHDLSGYEVEIKGSFYDGPIVEIFENFGMENKTVRFDIPLCRPKQWYEAERKNGPEIFDWAYRNSLNLREG